MITFCFDRVADQWYGYPNLAVWSADPYTDAWRQFDRHWPFSVPLRLLMYFRFNNVEYHVVPVNQAESAWYPVAFGWFDFDCDYVGLLSLTVIEKIKQGCVKILFYYHEGDNPKRIKLRLDSLCRLHSLPDNCYVFVSANTAADTLENCLYFPDHEFFFRHLNRHQPNKSENCARMYDFTLLSRTHKWWRATCVADLSRSGILDNSLWSYNTGIDIGDRFEDNPIEIDSIPGGRDAVKQFVIRGPYACDSVDQQQQNNHHRINESLYRASNIHIVLETHFDADQSGGAFITEKTYKVIKYGQPFVIAGPPGTLAQLKKDGYRTFDSVIDPAYDSITDNTRRWHTVKQLLQQLKNRGCQNIFSRCSDDVQHNQEMFLTRTVKPLNDLTKKLSELV